VTCIVATHDSTDALSFADETIVLQHGKLVDKAASYGLYNSPINKYVASLGEVNELKVSNLISLEEGEEDDTFIISTSVNRSGQRNVNGRRETVLL
jgi:ABC-type Fe3+/spermidine/putrescine transport system ATPase subunit